MTSKKPVLERVYLVVIGQVETAFIQHKLLLYTSFYYSPVVTLYEDDMMPFPLKIIFVFFERNHCLQI
jgi:hypothetical protein